MESGYLSRGKVKVKEARLPRYTWRDSWRWMRWDIPTRIAFLVGSPIIWIVIADVDPASLGLRLGLRPLDWVLVALWAASVALVSLTYRRWLWTARSVPGRSALLVDLPFYLVINPIAEELFFRGALLFGLANWVGMPWSVAISSIVFGFHHGFDRRFPFSFLVLGTLGGAVFGISAAHFDSIAPAIVLHAVADAVIFLASGPCLERLGVGLQDPGASVGG